MADAAQCLVELAGSVRIDLGVFLELALLSFGSDLRCQSKRWWLHRHGLLLGLMAFSGELLLPLPFFLCVGFFHRRIGFSIIIGLVHVDILGCLSIGWCRIFLIHLLHGDVIEFFLFIMGRRIPQW